RMHLPALAAKTDAPNFLRELVDGWRAFTEHTWVWLLTFWISLYFLITYAPFFVLGPYIAKHSLGGAAAWTIVVTGEAIGSLVGGLAGLRLRPVRSWAVVGPLFAVTSVQCALLALRAPALAIGAAAVFAGFAFSFGTVVWETSLQERIPREKLSRVGAYNWFGAMASVVLAALLLVEGVTILFLRPLLPVHIFVGMLLIPPVALKLASTGYRFVRYYTGKPEYVRLGPPHIVLRALAPLLVAATVG